MDSDGDYAGDYEVFLSFRGTDTRQGFTDILYEYMTKADIRVFKDDDKLAIGDKIDSILEAIDSSKICIPVFSPKFAESKWCLREVSRMVELKKIIVPVFYKVSPDDVKLKEESVYANDFWKLEQNHGDPVEIHKWKKSLREAASNTGRKLGDMSYTQFCKELVNEVLSKLGPRTRLDIDDHFVGSTNKAEVIRLLDMAGSSSQEVVYLGIHGMGGIGKTTLTKLIYNEFLSSFEYCGFVPDIREFSATKGVDNLPTHMYENLHPKSVSPFSRSGQIPNLFRKKKVLLILDDIDSDEQIKKIARVSSLFGSGSRIIMTSRNKQVFKDFESVSKCDIQYLEMEELGRGWSLELFSKCVFGNTSPPSSYLNLSERVVHYAGGLPLAITVIAKYLRNQKEVVWKEIIERLDKTPPKEVKDRLMISYDSLENEQKKIFLDIACQFNRHIYSEESSIFYMWQACELYPHWSLEVLQSRSLVKLSKSKFGDHVVLRLHDQLRDLGRYIVSAESGGDLTKQSRLWVWDHGRIVLMCKEIKQKNLIETLCLYGDDDDPACMVLTNEQFVSFDNLRYLAARSELRMKFKGDFSNLVPKLTWLKCDADIFEVRNFAPPNLVILDLSSSNVDENWEGWRQILMLKSLKVLDLSTCERLQRTPVFPENMPLESLNLGGCKELEYIDPSIGKLEHLTKLNLSGENKLRNLPDSIGGLVKLEQLKLNYTKFLVQIPESLGNLYSLQELSLVGSGLTCLPGSIIRLEKLEKLNLNDCKQLQELPKLPSSLKELHIECGGLNNSIPDLSNLQDLTSLWIDGANVGLLSFSKLFSLNSLTIRRCPSLVSLVNLDKLKQLRTLRLETCRSLVEIPGVGKLQSLTKLTVKYCCSLEQLDDISGLEELKVLRLIGCQKLTEIPGLFNLKRLISLNVQGFQSREILEFASLLKKLHAVVDDSEEDVCEGDDSEEDEDDSEDGDDDDNDDDDDGDDDVDGGDGEEDDDEEEEDQENIVEEWNEEDEEEKDNEALQPPEKRKEDNETLFEKLHGFELMGIPDRPRESMASSAPHLDLDLTSCYEDGNWATNQLENLPGEVEGNSCDVISAETHNLGGGLPTEQHELEDLPSKRRKMD